MSYYDVFESLPDFLLETIFFFDGVFFSIINFITENKYIFAVFMLPIVTTCVFIVLDFIFDVRDNIVKFDKPYNYSDNYRIFKNIKRTNQQRVYGDDYLDKMSAFEKERHQNRMKEYSLFRSNAELIYGKRKFNDNLINSGSDNNINQLNNDTSSRNNIVPDKSVFSSLKYIEPKLAFNNAIKKGLKNPDDYMYMYSKDGRDYFKHYDTRSYKSFKNRNQQFIDITVDDDD